MPSRTLAVALCRVSSLEQLESNSLSTQKGNILKCAEELHATIPEDAVWQGALSSKEGVNFKRKDLVEIFEYCRKHPAVKYLIVQEVDRFMRSPDEQSYWVVRFWYERNVRIWFADKPELNEDTRIAKLLRYMEGFKAAGSNDERQNKSIRGQTAALIQGRYPFSIKPGYKRGYENGIQEIDSFRGPILKAILVRIATRRVTPTEALIEFNNSPFMARHSPYKMDKFRKIVTDPFYAGIVEINKQVQVRNENGLHEPLISKDLHRQLLRIMNKKDKAHEAPHKDGNPKYPLSNLVSCALCAEKKNGRFVGLDQRNGKKNSPVYEKYRCRSCGKHLPRAKLHEQVEQMFRDRPITPHGVRVVLRALNIVWTEEEGLAEQEANRIKHKMTSLQAAIRQQVEAATDPSNISIKSEILDLIDKNKEEMADLEGQLADLRQDADNDRNQFLKFAYGFVSDIGANFLNTSVVSREDRLMCKQMLFSAGFCIDEKNKVYTPEISLLYRLATEEKGAEALLNSLLVHPKGLSLHPLRGEIARWRALTEVKFAEYLANE